MRLKDLIIMLWALTILSANGSVTHVNDPHSIEFFASNNVKEITLKTAYDRLTGAEQYDLQKTIRRVLQKNHIARMKFQDTLGVYRMASDNKTTADNTEEVDVSLLQYLTDKKIFSVAKQLAIALNQESVAVVIPEHTKLGKISVRFTSHQPSINEIVSLLREKLPASYNQAFSLRLVHSGRDFDNAKVTEIEWLGSKIFLGEVKRAFPAEKINYDEAKVFLVYQDGRKEPL